MKTNGDHRDIRLEVIPLSAGSDGRHYLVLFHDTAAIAGSPAEPKPPRTKRRATSPKESQEELDRLQKELIASREYLQSIIQDLEAANEELQSANEEILSSNEELQSTNEELDTAKEELQSTNEELNTVNEELHGRNEELARTNSDLVNLLNSVQIAIVIVASDLRIRRFTPMAERVLNLIPGDIGRPISQIKPNIDCPHLEQLITEVIETITVQHREVHDSQGRLFSLTVRPYKNVDNRIDGAVLALFNLEDARRHETEAQQARESAGAILNATQQPMVVLDAQGTVKSANAGFRELFGTRDADVVGRSIYDLDSAGGKASALSKFLENMSSEKATSATAALKSPTGGELNCVLNGRRVGDSGRETSLAIVAIQIAQ